MNNEILDTEIEKTTPQYKNGYAGFWERFGAAFLDGMILFVVQLLVLGAFGINFMDLVQGSANNQDPIEAFGNNYYWANIVDFFIGLYYFAQQESSEFQATLGKRAVGLVVTDINNQRISFQQASLRFLIKQIVTIVTLVCTALAMPDLIGYFTFAALLGYLIQPFTPKKQAFHDILAKTLVYKK